MYIIAVCACICVSTLCCAMPISIFGKRLTAAHQRVNATKKTTTKVAEWFVVVSCYCYYFAVFFFIVCFYIFNLVALHRTLPIFLNLNHCTLLAPTLPALCAHSENYAACWTTWRIRNALISFKYLVFHVSVNIIYLLLLFLLIFVCYILT